MQRCRWPTLWGGPAHGNDLPQGNEKSGYIRVPVLTSTFPMEWRDEMYRRERVAFEGSDTVLDVFVWEGWPLEKAGPALWEIMLCRSGVLGLCG